MNAIEGLRERTRGQVFTVGDEGYDAARRVNNWMHDKRPQVIVRCENAGDVMTAIDYARTQELELSVRGGGHSVPGFGTVDDGLVIDLSGMRNVRVDPVNRTARATAARRGATSTRRRTPSGWRRPAASSRPPASAD